MTGILIMAHGSRKKETEAELELIIAMVKKELALQKLNIESIEYTFLQFAKVDLEASLLKFVEKGINDIKIVPYFLFDGVHTKEDIPNLINAFLQKYPAVKVSLGRTLGTDERLAQIVADRVREML